MPHSSSFWKQLNSFPSIVSSKRYPILPRSQVAIYSRKLFLPVRRRVREHCSRGDGSGSTSDARIGHSYPLHESMKGGEGVEVDGVRRKPRPKGVRTLKEGQKMETEVRRMEHTIDNLSKRMDEGTTILQPIQAHVDQIRVDNAFKLLQIFPKDSYTYKKILDHVIKVQEEVPGNGGNANSKRNEAKCLTKKRRTEGVWSVNENEKEPGLTHIL